MKACGISMWQIVARPAQISLVLVALCLYIHCAMTPRSHMARREAVTRLGMESPFELMEEGRFSQDFEGLTIYVEKRKGPLLTNVRIYDARVDGVKREIRAKSGEVKLASGGKEIVIDLNEVRIDPFLDNRPGSAFIERWTLRIPNPIGRHPLKKRLADLTAGELLDASRTTDKQFPQLAPSERAQQRSKFLVELHKRLALSFSCFAFVLLGVPLGTKTHRKESSIGIAVSLFLVANFYLFIIVAQSLAKYPNAYPHLINWGPVAISVALGLYLTHRTD
jgi:lipopolysaccharide export system permease protein